MSNLKNGSHYGRWDSKTALTWNSFDRNRGSKGARVGTGIAWRYMAESIYSNRARKKGIAAPYAMHAMAASLSSSLSKTDERYGRSRMFCSA